jgi:hypothetical protein
MPDIVGPLWQRDALEFAAALMIEQAQFDLFGMCREQREVGAATGPGRAQRMRRSSGNPLIATRG